MKFGFFFALIFVVFFSARASAEYRVFQLSIQDTATGKTRSAIGTLDNLQYSGYHHVTPTEVVSIEATWMCWKRSDPSQDPDQRYCPNPKNIPSVGGPTSSSNRAPASVPAPAH